MQRRTVFYLQLAQCVAESHHPVFETARLVSGHQDAADLGAEVYLVCRFGVSEREALDAFAARVCEEMEDHATNIAGVPAFFVDAETYGLGMRCRIGRDDLVAKTEHVPTGAAAAALVSG